MIHVVNIVCTKPKCAVLTDLFSLPSLCQVHFQRMMILAYFFVGLLSSVNGQAQPNLTLSDAYVDRFMPVIITCTTGPISDSVYIFRNGTSVYQCNLPPFPCDNVLNIAEYSVVQNTAAGTTTMTISASNISRDTGSWTCQYGASTMSQPVLLKVGTPLNINITEAPEAVVIQTSCTFPAVIVNVTCSLNGTSLLFTYSVSTNGSTCTDPNEAAFTVTVSLNPTQSVTGSGFLNVTVSNGIHIAFRTGTRLYTFLPVTTQTTTSTAATTTTVISPSSSSWSTSSTTTTKPSSDPSTATTNNTSVTLTTESTANATNSASTLTSLIKTESTTSVTNNTTSDNTVEGSTSTSSTTGSSKISSKNVKDDVDINVIVPAVVVPGALLLIGVLILLVVLCKRRHRTRKNVNETLDVMDVQNRDSNVNRRKVSLDNGRAADKFNTVYTIPDGFIIYPGPAAMSTARPHKDKNYHAVTDQYNNPYAGTSVYQTSYDPRIYTSARAYTHKDEKHHNVPHQYSKPYTGTYVHVPSTYMSDKDYNHKGKNYDSEEPKHHQTPNQMGTRRPAYMQTAYYPQTGYSGQVSQDVYYRGGGQYLYGQRSRSHHDHNGRQQQREYNNLYEMDDYGGIRAGYLQTAQYGKNTAFYY